MNIIYSFVEMGLREWKYRMYKMNIEWKSDINFGFVKQLFHEWCSNEDWSHIEADSKS